MGSRRKNLSAVENAKSALLAALEDSPKNPFLHPILKETKDFPRIEERRKVEAAKIQANLHWMDEGDCPTPLFCRAVRDKRRHECITIVRNDSGEEITGD